LCQNPTLSEAGEAGNPYLWVGAILAGFWVVLLGVLGIVLLLS
jgi:hypothetical protein